MADPIGINFVPTDEQALQGRKNLATSGGIPEAVKFLQLQIPRFAGAGAITPDALLHAQPNNPVSSVVESILRSMGIGGTPPPSTGGSGETGGLGELLRGAGGIGAGGSAPAPRVTIGARPVGEAPVGGGGIVDSGHGLGGLPLGGGVGGGLTQPRRPQAPGSFFSERLR